MGVYLGVSMNPFKIEPNQWKVVFKEAMLISNYEGLAYIKQKIYHGIKVPCLAYSNPVQVEKTEYTVLKRFLEENPTVKLKCWDCIGDIFTGSNMESFSLYDNIEFYRYQCQNSWYGTCEVDMEKALSVEMLLQDVHLEECEKKYENYDKGISWIMHAKTQGQYGHMGLLEIGCLLADRFPGAVSIGGDISYGQCVRAVSRVNEILGITIKLPDQYHHNIVFERLSRMIEDRGVLLELLHRIYDGPKEEEYYNFIKLNFTEKEIGYYYIKEYGENEKKTLIKEWFKQGGSLETLCEIMVDTYSGQETSAKEIDEFIDALIQCKIHVENKEVRDPTEFNATYKSTPDTVGNQFAKIFGHLAGLKNYYVDVYIPVEELITVCNKFFGKQYDVKFIVTEAIDKVTNDENLKCKDTIYETLASSSENQNKINSDKKYDHVGYRTLCGWDVCDTIHPNLDNNLISAIESLKEFGENGIGEYRKEHKLKGSNGNLTELIEFAKFISKNATHTILFKENDLDYILSEEFTRESTLGSAIIGLYFVKLDNVTELLVNAFCLNFELLKFYVTKWEKRNE